jgi:hypothetical protein
VQVQNTKDIIMKKLLTAIALVLVGLGVYANAQAAQCQPESVCVIGQGCYIVTVCR